MTGRDSGFVLWVSERRLPPEWGGVVPAEVFLAEGRRLAELAREQGLVLRLLGGVAIRLHCQNQADFARRLGRLVADGPFQARQEFTDLDFAAYRRQRPQLPRFFAGLGYIKRKTTLSTAASERHIYFHPDGWFQVDVFFDKLLFNHDVPLKGRLELDFPTITPTDLLLEKLQIVGFSEKDLKDTWLLLRAHPLAPDRADAIDPEYIAWLLGRDWGFWYTVTTNLRRCRELALGSALLTEADRADIVAKVDGLLGRLEAGPRTPGWKVRALVGPRLRWYRPVETEETVIDYGIWRLKPEGPNNPADNG
jgi:hypothetical protein